MKTFNYERGPDGVAKPTMYPGKGREKDWSVPDNVQKDYVSLNSIIESKYDREYLKVCAFYNKLFPSLKFSDWTRTSYNAQPFTVIDQERNDTGTGLSANYLKEIIDQIVSRLGVISFVPELQAEDPSIEFLIYKDEAERILRKYIKDDELTTLSLEAFHDAAILGYSHAILDPWTGKLFKANDWEVGIYEAQLNKSHIVQMLYRDYAFPVSDVLQYVADLDGDKRKEMLESLNGKTVVDFKMYIDCILHKCFVTINNDTLPEREYPFDEVLMATFAWDIGFTKVTTTSLFDLLYPVQREINKIKAKIQQIIRMYKGAVPVFNSDVDLAMKAISNGSGEALYVDSTRPIDSLMTVINPTPIDTELDGLVTSLKAEMYELAGIEQVSFDMENMRSAAAVMALDQARDNVFQAQMQGRAKFIKKLIMLYVRWLAKDGNEKWEVIERLLDESFIKLEPQHIMALTGSENEAKEEPEINYLEGQVARIVSKILKGTMNYHNMPYYVEPLDVLTTMALTMVKMGALEIEIPDNVHQFMIAGFVDQVRKGEVKL